MKTTTKTIMKTAMKTIIKTAMKTNTYLVSFPTALCKDQDKVSDLC